MVIELTNEELKMVNEALWSYLSENDSLNPDMITTLWIELKRKYYDLL
jgi:hypothetical protein